MISTAIRVFAGVSCAILLASIPACTARSITITSNPPGAEVSVNRRIIGNTPVRVGFTHYGTYRIELRLEKFETLVKEECIKPPAYGYDPITFVTDSAIPARLQDEIYLHYVMKPAGEVSERTALLERANQARLGHIRDPITGADRTIAYNVPPKTPEMLAEIAKRKAAANPDAVVIDLAAETATPSALGIFVGKSMTMAFLRANTSAEFKVRPIGTQEPEGAKISKELNLTPPAPEKKPDAPKPPVNPNAPKEPKKDPRVPKGEELDFEKPSVPTPKPDDKAPDQK